MHDVDNLSDHDPAVLHLSLSSNKVNLSERIYTPRPSWARATAEDTQKYRAALS